MVGWHYRLDEHELDVPVGVVCTLGLFIVFHLVQVPLGNPMFSLFP